MIAEDGGSPQAPRVASPVSGATNWRLVGACVGLLALSNVVANELLTAWAYVPWNLSVSAVLLFLARWAGLDWASIGLDRTTVGRSLRWGLAGAASVAVIFGVAVLLPGTRELFDDLRASDPSVIDLGYHVVVQIPLGTVVLEELAFRGVLPAALGWHGLRWRWRPALLASVLFGLWHVLPSGQVAALNVGVADTVGNDRWLVALLAVAATTLAGVVLCWWRWIGRGLLTSATVHVATNSIGFAVAWSVVH